MKPQDVDSIGNASHLYTGGARFEYRTERPLS
jgi:hypothetical protein